MKNKWNNITEKLAPINEFVFVMNPKTKDIRIGKLVIYDGKLHELNFDNNDRLYVGDIHWVTLNESLNDKSLRFQWNTIKFYPLWISKKEMCNMVLEEKTCNNESDRFEILDL